MADRNAPARFQYWKNAGLSSRAASVLARGGIENMDQLRKTPARQLLRLYGMGPLLLIEVQEKVGNKMVKCPLCMGAGMVQDTIAKEWDFLTMVQPHSYSAVQAAMEDGSGPLG